MTGKAPYKSAANLTSCGLYDAVAAAGRRDRSSQLTDGVRPRRRPSDRRRASIPVLALEAQPPTGLPSRPTCRGAGPLQVLKTRGFAGDSRQASPVRPVYNADQPITALKGTGIRTPGPPLRMTSFVRTSCTRSDRRRACVRSSAQEPVAVQLDLFCSASHSIEPGAHAGLAGCGLCCSLIASALWRIHS